MITGMKRVNDSSTRRSFKAENASTATTPSERTSPIAACPSRRMSCVVNVMANSVANTASARLPNSRSRARRKITLRTDRSHGSGSDRKSEKRHVALTSAKQTGDNPCAFPAIHGTGARDACLYLAELQVPDRDAAWKARQLVLAAADVAYRFDRMKSKKTEATPLAHVAISAA